MTIDQRSNGIKAWLVCGAASLFFFFEFMQINMFNAVSPGLIESFKITGAKLGELSAYYFFANVIFLFVAGMILDRFSTRKVILIAMTACVGFTFIFANATEIWQAEVSRFVTGAGGSFCFLSSVRLASRWFPPRRMALAVGCIVTFAMLGGMIAQTPFALLTDSIGWRKTLVMDGFLGILIVLIIAVVVKDYPRGYKHTEAQPVNEMGLIKTGWLTIKNLQNWKGGLYTSLMNLPIFLLGAMWGSLYLMQMRGLSRPDSTTVTSMIFIGTIIGSPFMGWMSDRLGRRRMPMIITALLSLAIILVVMYAAHLSLLQLIVLFFLLGFITSAQIISYPLITESNPMSLTGSAQGLAATLIMAGGFLQPIFGYFMELQWDHKLINGQPIYTWNDYQTGMMIMPIAFVLAFFVSLLVRETYGRAYERKIK